VGNFHDEYLGLTQGGTTGSGQTGALVPVPNAFLGTVFRRRSAVAGVRRPGAGGAGMATARSDWVPDQSETCSASNPPGFAIVFPTPVKHTQRVNNLTRDDCAPEGAVGVGLVLPADTRQPHQQHRRVGILPRARRAGIYDTSSSGWRGDDDLDPANLHEPRGTNRRAAFLTPVWRW